jgi:hypothetical protein
MHGHMNVKIYDVIATANALIMNLIETTNKMQLCSINYYSNVS